MFSEKQILSIHESTRRLNIWVGAIRSGKTYASIWRFVKFLRNGPPGDVMIVGVNRTTIQRNVLNDLYNIVGGNPPTSKSTETQLYGRNVYFVGAHDESSVRAIQGATLACAYVDEVTCIPAPCWKMLTGRLSVKGAQLFATCNPEGPSHWLKKDYIDRSSDLDMAVFNFTLDDNPSLDESYKEAIKKEYTGVWYQRFIEGKWAFAHGLIYDSFDYTNLVDEPKNNATYYIAAADFGISNATACVVAAVNPKVWPQITIVDEYYYDSIQRGRSQTDAELADDVYKMLRYRGIRAIYIDPSAAGFKMELRNRNLPVLDASNDVLEGIRCVSKLISQKNLVIMKSCRNLIDCIQSYVWDHKAADKGIDKPLKKFDHLADSLRYLCFSAFPRGITGHADDHRSIESIREEIYGDAPFFTGGY